MTLFLQRVRRGGGYELAEGSLEAAFSLGEGGGEAIVPAETMGAAGRHAAVRA